MWGLQQKQNARRADKIRLYGHLRRYKKIVKKTYIIYDINNLNWRMAFPVKFFEAMASGTPVIASKDSSYGKLVEEKNIGYTVEWNNIKAIRETILCSIKNKDEYEVKRSNCINLKNEYSWEGKINELIDYMEQKV